MTAPLTPQTQKHQPVFHIANYLVLLCLVLALPPLTAAAAGLGRVAGNPVMGEQLTLEVPLLDAENVTLECIQLLPHASASDSQFFPRKATIDLKRKADGNQALITIRGPEFTQPVLEFRLTVGCGNQISRDYVLLPSPGRELRYDPVPITKPAVMPVAENSPPAIIKDTGNTASPSSPSLNKMARTRYPLQPKARAKFKRMVREANPAVLEGVADNAPIPANAGLQIPANIPKKRIGPYVPKAKKPRPAPASTPNPLPAETTQPAQAIAPASAEKPAPAPVVTDAPRDRLTISSGIGTSGATQPTGTPEGALQEKATASFASQDDVAAKLTQSESAYNELKQQVLAMESRMAALEQERQRLQKETISKSDWALVETTGMILVGGLLGALLMIIMQRRRRNNFAESNLDLGTIGRR